MMKIKSVVKGVRYFVPEEERAKFYEEIKGECINLRPEPTNIRDHNAIIAMYGGDPIGRIDFDMRAKIHSCFEGMGVKKMRATVIDVDPIFNTLSVQLDVSAMAPERKLNDLDSLVVDYDGPLFRKHYNLSIVNFVTDDLLEYLEEGRDWDKEMQGCYEKMLKMLTCDISAEMCEKRLKIYKLLLESNNPLLNNYAKKLRIEVQRLSNEDNVRKIWAAVKKDVSKSFLQELKQWGTKENIELCLSKLPRDLRDVIFDKSMLIGKLLCNPIKQIELHKIWSIFTLLNDNEKEEEKTPIEINADVINVNSNNTSSLDNQEKDDDHLLISRIAGSFYGKIDVAREFLNLVKNMRNDPQITQLVKQWLKEGLISPLSCNKDLREPLYEYGLYHASQKNWDKMIK